MRLIGRRCKRGDAFSLLVLIGRGLDLLSSLLSFVSLSLFNFEDFYSSLLVGVNGCEVPPVPIPNTEVKLIRVEDTWLVTTRENRSMPALKQQSGQFLDCCFLNMMGPLAQLVRATGS